MSKGGFTFIMTNKNNTTLYVGVTSDIQSRVKEHKEKMYSKSFTARYNLDQLVYFEFHELIETAIEREKQLKAGSRKKKIELIDSINQGWRDLFDDIKDW